MFILFTSLANCFLVSMLKTRKVFADGVRKNIYLLANKDNAIVMNII